MTNPCLAPGCQEQVPEPLLVCREHWAQLPAEIRRGVNHAGNRYASKPRDHTRLAELLQARRAVAEYYAAGVTA